MLTFTQIKLFIALVITVFILPIYVDIMTEYVNYVGHDYGRDGTLNFIIPSPTDLLLMVVLPGIVTFIVIYFLLGLIRKIYGH